MSAQEEYIQSILDILKETAEKFSFLNQEGQRMIFDNEIVAGKEKLKQAAQLLVDLPDLLSDLIEKVDPKKRDRLIEDIGWFRKSAQKALERNSVYALSGLLSDRGRQVGDKNDLEELIVFLGK